MPLLLGIVIAALHLLLNALHLLLGLYVLSALLLFLGKTALCYLIGCCLPSQWMGVTCGSLDSPGSANGMNLFFH